VVQFESSPQRLLVVGRHLDPFADPIQPVKSQVVRTNVA